MPHIGAPELILVVALALIIFGPGKLPEVGKAIGKTIKEFKRSSKDVIEENLEATADKEGSQAVKATKG
ncbi:MAG: Sec-independent protein translocase protein TatA [Desulfotomaculum sp. 46_296]|nr:MAG: Sec-independent protein translocase protein TatA [Desulfotomaculum sp. 46_296]HAU30846.1 twin-arginine translocase TatA/TatE family subunit [Desulfotomaculum sp.]